MYTHEEMIGLQAEKHDLINAAEFRSIEGYVLHLIHTAAYSLAARLAENKRVLDLGCNTGYGTGLLFRSARRVVGVDVSEKAIVSAKNQYGPLGIEFQQIDGKTLPFDAEAFDVVVCCQVIEHIVDYKRFIEEMKRVVTAEGLFILTTPNALLRLYPGMKPWNVFHVREFNHIDLKSLLDTFFNNVSIFGLFAIEPLYSIEVSRLARAREDAKSNVNMKNSDQTVSKRANIGEKLLRKMIHLSTGTRQSFTRKSKAELQALMTTHGVDDFFYRRNDLESALDLLAVCGNDETVIETIKCNLAEQSSTESAVTSTNPRGHL